MDPFVKKIQNFVFHEKLFEAGEGIVVGVSGGPDSVCLARVLNELKDKYKLNLSLFHVNYGLRGKDSEDDEKFVREFAEEMALSLNVIKYKEKKRGNQEEILRQFRYKKLEEQRKKLGFQWIAVAHTQDDQVETFLLNLARGAGPIGLGGMLAKNDHIIRPLIFLKKSEILEFFARIKQSYRIDKTNVSEEFFRNRIRGKVIPFLEKELEPKIKERIYETTLLLQRSNSYIEKEAEKSYNNIAKIGEGCISIEIDRFLMIDDALQGYIFRNICSRIRGDLREISQKHFDEFMKIVKSKKSKRQEFIFRGVRIERKGGRAEFRKLKS